MESNNQKPIISVLQIVNKIYKFQYGNTQGSFLGKMIFNNASISLTVSGVLR